MIVLNLESKSKKNIKLFVIFLFLRGVGGGLG